MKKYKIFVSANQKELRKERFAVKETIFNSSTFRDFFDVFLFEELSAKGASPVSTYLKKAENSDIYIGILGNQYGTKGKDGLSATEREFRHFVKARSQKEILLFVKGRKDILRDNGTQKFFKIVKSNYIYKRFINIADLKTQVLNSLISFLDEKGILSRVPFDEAICKEAKYSAIDEKEVKNFLENRAIKLHVNIPKISIKNFLLNTLKIVKEENKIPKPTNTAILFFSRDASEYIPQNEIRVARFKGTIRAQTIDSREIKGPIYRVLDEVELFFRRNTRLANKIVEFKRIDIPEYPHEAIREAVINAIAHRDYHRLGAPIIISIFDDRVEVSSPGKLLPGLNIRNLEGHHETRNKKICGMFHETKDMERFGTGIGKMKRLMKEYGLSEPEFKEEGDFFVVKFYGPAERILDLAPTIPKERQVNLRELGLNIRQIEALRLLVNEKMILTIAGYIKRFKVTDKTARMDLQELVSKSFVDKIGKTKGAYFKAKNDLPK